MKLLITLNDTQEAKNFIKELDHEELKENLDFYYPSILELTIKSEDIYVTYNFGCLWVQTDEYLLLRVPMNLVHDFIVKESN